MLYALVLVALAGANGSLSQDQEVKQTEAPFTFKARVNLVNVPVVVRDKKGREIGNLQSGNFQLYDRGKLQEISKFTVEKTSERTAALIAHLNDSAGGADRAVDQPSVVPSHFVAYFFDDQHLRFSDLAQVREAALKHLNNLQPTDRVAIVSASGRNNLDFTADRAALHSEIDKITPQIPASDLSTCPKITMNEFYAALQDNGANSGATAALAQDAMQCSGTLLAAQAKVQMLLDEIKAKDLANTKTELDVLDRLTRRMATLPGERVIVLVSPGFILHDPAGQYDRGETSRKLIEEAVRARVTINALDARGVEVIMRGGDASQRRTSANSGSFDSFGALLSGEALQEIADGTGGKLFHNNNDFAQGFRESAGAPEYEYILGFSPQNLKLDGSFHQLKVVVKGNDLTVQARRGYYAPNHEIDAAEQAAAEIDEAMFSREELLDIPCNVQVQYFKTAPALARLSVVAKIDLRGVHFRKADGRNLDTLTFVTGIFSPDGNLVKGWNKTVDLRFNDERLEVHLANGLSEKTSFDVAPGKYVVRLVVRDSEGQSMSALNVIAEVR